MSIGAEMRKAKRALPQGHNKPRSAPRRFLADIGGSVAITIGVFASVLIAASGAAVDYASLVMQKNKLQSAADAATLLAAREMQIANTTKDQLISIAGQTLETNLGTRGGKYTFNVDVGEDKQTLTVEVKAEATTYFMDWSKDGTVTAKAVAAIHDAGVPLCVLGLSHEKDGKEPGLTLNENAQLTGEGCAVYSNARKKDSIESNSGALLQAGLICTAGGVEGDVDNFNPSPVTDCPSFQDPLLNRPEPAFGSCDYTDFQLGFDKRLKVDEKDVEHDIKDETADETGKKTFKEKEQEPIDTSHYDRSVVVLEPGVYCGGLFIGSGITARLNPGNYIIKDGPLYVTEEASIEGEYVGFFFAGKDSNIYFGPHTNINLSAPKDGEMAGLLFFEERNHKKMRPHAILSDGARKLEGTIYLPAGHLYVDADAPIADKSAYTAIIVSRLELFAGPHLVLNTDYSATEVPVPQGVGAMSGDVYLKE